MRGAARSRILLMSATLAGSAAFVSGSAYAQASASPYTSAVRYDVLGRVTGTIAPDPDGAGALPFPAVRNTYDNWGRLTKVESGSLAAWQSEAVAPANWPAAAASPSTGFTVHSSVESTYDPVGRKLSDLGKGSDGVAVSLTQYSYTAAGDVECTAVRMNPAVFATVLTSTPACTLGPAGSFGNDRITKNVHGAPGLVVQIQKGVGTNLLQAYATYTYNGNWKVTSVTDARGFKATMSYDGFDRQSRWTFPDKVYADTPSTNDYEEYTYDSNGNRTSLRKRDGSTLTFEYDALNRNTRKLVPDGNGLAATHTRDVYYGYDLQGHPTYARFDSATGEGIVNTFNSLGRLTSTTQALDGTNRTLSFLYNAEGRRGQIAYPDGGWPNGTWVNYDYDGLGRLQAVLPKGAWYDAIYNFDAAGRRSAFHTGFYTAYGYDAASRLTGLSNYAGTGTYTNSYTFAYNPAGQLAQSSKSNDSFAWTGHVDVDRNYTTNGLNQYSAAGPATLAYDANGNLTGDGAANFTYDVENRLVGRTSATATTSLRYDPLGRLYEVNDSAAGITRFLHDGSDLIAEYNASGTMLRRYVHGSDPGDDPIAWYEGATMTVDNERLLRTDWQGSIVAVSADRTATTMLAINRYDEYGIPQSTNAGRFQYTGQAWLPEIGMYYYKARMYSPTLGRFMQTDPIGYEDGLNLYAYVGNDPVNGVDPTGLYSCELKSACNAAEAARRGLLNARENARNSGTAGGNKSAAQLTSLLSTLGTNGDQNGLTIMTGDLASEKGNDVLAQYDRETKTITFDTKAIGQSNFGIGAVAAHELSHRQWDLRGWQTGPNKAANEVAAYSRQYLTQFYSGGDFGYNYSKSISENLRPGVEQSTCGPMAGTIWCVKAVDPVLNSLPVSKR